ncbi:MAG: phage baseplate assembly protein V [Bacillota bacterium]
MSDIVALLRELIRAELAHHIPSQIGVVEAAAAHSDPSDNENYGCDVRLRGRDLLLTGVPLATDHLGTAAPPAKGDLVLVHFVGGDPDQPVIAGRFYSDQLRPPPYGPGEIVTHLPPDAGESDRLELALKGGRNGSRSFTLKLPSDLTLTVTDKRVEAAVGSLTLTIDAEAGEATLTTSGSSLTLKDGGDIALQGNGNLTIEAQGSLEIKAGANLKLNAGATAELKGSVVNIN